MDFVVGCGSDLFDRFELYSIMYNIRHVLELTGIADPVPIHGSLITWEEPCRPLLAVRALSINMFVLQFFS